MNEITLILPNQLFEINPSLSKNREVFLVEEKTFFSQYKFHKQKLVLHRASMKYYQNYLEKKGYKVNYIEFNQNIDLRDKIIHTTKINNKNIKLTAPKFIYYNNPSFLSSKDEFEKFFNDKKHYSQTSFYINQRKKLNVLLENNQKPKGGKWTYDRENRKNFDFKIEIPKIKNFKENLFIKEAKEYIQKNFPNNYGSMDYFIYPITHKEVREWFEDFLINRLENFGTYEDSVVENEPILFHSCLSYALNIGLITPEYVINETLLFSQKNNIPLNSLEGFIRQIVGWREFIKNIYLVEGQKMKKLNFFSHQNKLPKAFYIPNTKIKPIDELINRTLKYAYNHHIERLMFLGNFMFLCEIHPDEIYKWFMEMYIDAYEWVMVPNIYGMSQYSDGGSMITKPYFSSSNYLLKMSNHKKGDWSEIFDALYWRFIDKNKDFLFQNPRLRIISYYLQNISQEKLDRNKKIAATFLREFLSN